MNPISRPITPVAVFKLDEELDKEYQNLYQTCKAIYINYGSISGYEIMDSYCIDFETAQSIINDLKKEFS